MSLDPISAVLDLGNTLITRIFPDPAQQADAKLKLLELQQSGELASMTAQTDINKIEAQSTSLFVSCLLYTSPSPRDGLLSRMPSSA